MQIKQKFRNAFFRFKNWAFIEYKPKPKGIVMHEDMVDFIHGSLIGMLLGFMIGLFLLRTL